jgi:hypothetical protein
MWILLVISRLPDVHVSPLFPQNWPTIWMFRPSAALRARFHHSPPMGTENNGPKVPGLESK